MKPWERRLKDLAQLLKNCHATYFEPELFRMNTNQFLQTARTVTFLIQKNKETIPNYKPWYQAAVIEGWKDDELMTWAKDARNFIEKEGDLELYSSLNVRLIFSYFEEEDVLLEVGNAELLRASIKKLIRIAQKVLPSGISDGALVKIERRWVTASLPKWEILHALNYVYARLFECCKGLAILFGDEIDPSIQNLSEGETQRERSRHIRYIKLNGLKSYSMYSKTVGVDKAYELPDGLKSIKEQHSETPKTLSATFEVISKIAEATFEHFGNHKPMLFILDKHWQPIDYLSTEFADQADKFIFWRVMADRIANLKAAGFIWIAEAWLKVPPKNNTEAIRHIPAIGERLQVMAIDKTGVKMQVSWNILRASKDEKPLLERIEQQDIYKQVGTPHFLRPALIALGAEN